jgi:hypothetical protein
MKQISSKKHVIISFAMLWLIGSVITDANSQDSIPALRSNLSSDRYEINQTFGGVAFWKDNNIWVYNAAFAEIFGMPKVGIDPQLTGIEAAAFRIEEPGYKLCGMGGKAEQCMNSSVRCMLDVYIDEQKHPLPWAYPEQVADWYRRYNSSFFLSTPTETESSPAQATARFTPNPNFSGRATLRPFADPVTTQEAIFIEDARKILIDEQGGDFVPVLGYKRQAMAGLTLLSLSQGCGIPNDPGKSRPITFRLEVRDKLVSGIAIKRLYEFALPTRFNQQIQAVLQAVKEANAQYFRSLLNLKPVTESK